MSTSVFTDADGLYIFPAMPKGNYHVWAQTVGLATGQADVALEGPKVVRQDFSLQPAKDVTRQMTGADWFNSMPVDTAQDRRLKDVLYTNCTGCHTPNYPLQNRFDKAGWVAMMDLMKVLNTVGIRSQKEPYPIIQYHEQELAEYLAKVHGPDSPVPAKLNVVSRPKGLMQARVVVTEYAVEPGETPGQLPVQDGSDWSQGVPSSLNGVRGTHDIEIDNAGNLWFVNSQPNPTRTYARVDAKTGEVTNFKVLDDKGNVRTSHGLRKDANGILWFNVYARGEGGRGGLARLDPATMKFDLYTPPEGMNGVAGSIDIDGKGKIWGSTDYGAVQFDPDTQKFTEFKSKTMKTPDGGGCSTMLSCGITYGVGADSQGNGYWAQMGLDIIGKAILPRAKHRKLSCHRSSIGWNWPRRKNASCTIRTGRTGTRRFRIRRAHDD